MNKIFILGCFDHLNFKWTEKTIPDISIAIYINAIISVITFAQLTE